MTIYPPALHAAMTDARLSWQDRAALLVLWQHLSPARFEPMKNEVLASLMKTKRQAAGRTLRRLVEVGYLKQAQLDPRGPRLFLLVNVVEQRLEAA